MTTATVYKVIRDDDDSDVTDAEYDDDVWAKVPWDTIADEKAINNLTGMDFVNPKHPNLPVTKARLNPDNLFVDYIPRWTDPDFDEKVVYTQKNLKPQMERRNLGDAFWKMRPALRPDDAVRNPTEFARRYGIHPDERKGTSRLTPTHMAARGVALNTTLVTPSGRTKNYLDISDLEAAREDFAKSETTAKGLTFVQSLEDVAAKSDGHDGDVAQGLLTLLEVTSRDEAFQQFFFHAFSTGDLMRNDILNVNNNFDSDLAGPLHPYFAREKWFGTDELGNDQFFPKLYYKLDGITGEWAASNETVWMALQPALQLATRVLNANHPAWVALLDLNTRRRIPRVLDPRTDREIANAPLTQHRYAMYPGPPDYDQLIPELKRVWDLGFDWAENTHQLLLDRVRFFIGDSQVGMAGDPTSAACGWTGIREQGVTRILNQYTIRIQISAEILWPLISSAYSYGEKMMCSFSAASTVLHELAHAVTNAHTVMCLWTDQWLQGKPDRHLVSTDLQHAIMDLSSEFGDVFLGEATWGLESEVEAGFCFENQLWGGFVEGVVCRRSSFHEYPMQVNAGVLQPWPIHRSFPHTPLNAKSQLYTSPPSVDIWMRPLPVNAVKKLFSEAFWRDGLAQLGTTALRLEADAPKVAVLSHFRKQADLKRAFGNSSGKWMWVVLGKLDSNQYGVVAEYLQLMCQKHAGVSWTQKRWAHEQRRWDAMEKEIDRLTKRVQETQGEFTMALDLLTAPREKLEEQLKVRDNEWLLTELGGEGAKPKPTMIGLIGDLEREMQRLFHQLLRRLTRAHNFLWVQAQYIQGLAFQYGQVTVDVREDLQWEYGRDLCFRVQFSHEYLARVCIDMVKSVSKGLEASDRLEGATRDALAKLGTQFQAVRDALRDTRKFLEDDADSVEKGWQGKLSLVQTDLQEERIERLSRLARIEYQRAVREQPIIAKAIDLFHDIVTNASKQSFDKFGKPPKSIEALAERVDTISGWTKPPPEPFLPDITIKPPKAPEPVKPPTLLAPYRVETNVSGDAPNLELPDLRYTKPPTYKGRPTGKFLPVPPSGGGFAAYSDGPGFTDVDTERNVLIKNPFAPARSTKPTPWGPVPYTGPLSVAPQYAWKSGSRTHIPPSQITGAGLSVPVSQVHKLLGRVAFNEYAKPERIESCRDLFVMAAKLGQPWAPESLLKLFQGEYGPGQSGYGPDFLIPPGCVPTGVPAGTVKRLVVTTLEPRPKPARLNFGVGQRILYRDEAAEMEKQEDDDMLQLEIEEAEEAAAVLKQLRAEVDAEATEELLQASGSSGLTPKLSSASLYGGQQQQPQFAIPQQTQPNFYVDPNAAFGQPQGPFSQFGGGPGSMWGA